MKKKTRTRQHPSRVLLSLTCAASLVAAIPAPAFAADPSALETADGDDGIGIMDSDTTSDPAAYADADADAGTVPDTEVADGTGQDQAPPTEEEAGAADASAAFSPGDVRSYTQLDEELERQFVTDEAAYDAYDSVKIDEEDAGTGSTDRNAAYDTKVVEPNLLFSHTDKTSELPSSGKHTPIDDRAYLSCDASIYDGLGFSSNNMLSEVQSYADDASYQNPLSGYSFKDPNELVSCFVIDHYQRIWLADNVKDASDPSKIADSLDGLTTFKKEFEESHDNQTHNGIGIDCDGDGIDELADYALLDNDGSSIWINVYKRNGSKWDEWGKKSIFMDSDTYVLDIPANECKGYVAMAAGDYDDDGHEELAIYMPDVSHHKNGECKDARVVILDFDKGGEGSVLRQIYLKDIRSDFQYMVNGPFLPTVSLSNSHMRLGAASGISVKHYDTACDLVINVSVPRKFGSGKNLNSVTAVYGYKEDSILFKHEYKPSGGARMGAVNSCEGDLNGDGFDEVIVAGMKENGVNGDTTRGSYDASKNYVNILYYDGSNYQLAWGSPKEIPAPGNLNPNEWEGTEPIAMCAGHYMADTPDQTDQLCVQGVFFSCDGTKISGAATEIRRDGNNNISYCAIPNTEPYCEKKNYESASFTKLYSYDISRTATNSDRWIDSCTSGRFLDGAGTECVAIVYTDDRSANEDRLYMDLALVGSFRTSENAPVSWAYKCYDNVIDNENEDDNGTCLYATFVNSDNDSYYYRYLDTTSSYSAPVLYAVLQSPPYYREANGLGNYKYTIKSGVSESLSFSGNLGLTYTTKASGGFIASLGTSFSAGLNFALAHTLTKSTTIQDSLYLPANGLDYAVCFVIPYIINHYEILKDPSKPDETETYNIEEPLKPVFTALPIEKYNKAVSDSKARQIEKFKKNSELRPELPVDYTAPILKPFIPSALDSSSLPPSSSGDPLVYFSSQPDIKPYAEDESMIITSDTMTVTNEKDVRVSEMAIDLSESKGNSFGVTATFTIGIMASAGIGQNREETGFSGSLAVGTNYCKTSTSGCLILMGLNGVKSTMMDGVRFDPYSGSYGDLAQDTGYTGSSIRHYVPGEEGAIDYRYSANGIMYPMKSMKTDMDFVDSNGDYSGEYHPEDCVWALSYIATPRTIPPEGPTKLVLQSVKQVGELDPATGATAMDVTLVWDSEVRNEDRYVRDKLEGYNIYMSDGNVNEATIYLVNQEGLIPRDRSAKYMSYTIHLTKGQYTNSSRFYIAPAYASDKNGMLDVSEGTLTASCVVKSFPDLIDGKVKILEQPESQPVLTDEEAAKAVFTIKADKKSDLTGDLKFYWSYGNEQGVLQPADNADVTVEPAGDGNGMVSTFTLHVPADQANTLIGRPVQCTVYCDTYSVRSDIVTVLPNKESVSAGYVTNMLLALPAPEEVTILDKGQIEAARAAYEELSPEEKEKIVEALLAKLFENESVLEKLKAAQAIFENAIKVSGYNGVYDGQYHGINMEVPEGAVVKYGIEGAPFDLTDNPSFLNVGTYRVFYEIHMEGLASVLGMETIEIKPSDEDVTPMMLHLDRDGVWRLYENGVWCEDYTGTVDFDGGTFFVAEGVLCQEANGLNQNAADGLWYFLSQGQVQTQHTGFAEYDNNWFMITEGMLDETANGLYDYDDGLFAFAAGKLRTDINGLWMNPLDDKWYFLANGQVQKDYSGVAEYNGEFFVVEQGVFQNDFNGVTEYDGHWFTVVNGQLGEETEASAPAEEETVSGAEMPVEPVYQEEIPVFTESGAEAVAEPVLEDQPGGSDISQDGTDNAGELPPEEGNDSPQGEDSGYADADGYADGYAADADPGMDAMMDAV